MSRIEGKRPRMSAKRERTERLQVILPTDELAAIDEFRFQARMPSRAAAVRELLRRGLASADD
jgi:metal-responsive CopG/Arc/MetJ family transcriptional regulator